MNKLLTTIFTLVLGLFLTVTTAFAAVSVRLEQPKSPNNQTSFDLIFVTLDTDSNPITVKCFKKGPSDGAFSQFGSDIVLSSGGNTSNCSVNNSVVTGDGTYSFQVTANNGSATATSNTVSVEVKSGTPGTPTNYSKDKITPCEYKIHFRTADDGGKTAKVEIYRSEAKSFGADSGSRVGSIGIGSNTDHDFIQSIPDCNKTYYYAVRAFDNAGNGSGVIGDSETLVTINTINPTGTQGSGAIPVSGSSTGGAAGAGTGTGGSVLGEGEDGSAVTPSGTPEDEEQKTDEEMEQDVKGAADSAVSGAAKYLPTIAGVVLVAIIVYWFLRRRIKSN